MNVYAPEIDVDDLAYTKQFFTITREGHTRPAPEFGAPTLVWHVAFWPRQEVDPQNTDASKVKDVDHTPEAFRKFEVSLRKEYACRRQRLINDFNALLRNLQTRGRPWRKVGDNFEPNIEQFELKPPVDWHEPPKEWRDPTFEGSPVPVFSAESIGFTLWWHVVGEKPLSDRDDKEPDATDVRVRVQADVHADYSTISFYMDPGKAWRQIPVYSDSILTPLDLWTTSTDRRAKILSAVAHIKKICEARTNSPLVGESVMPEPDPMPDFVQDAASLKAYADYLYDGIWDEFCAAFGISLQRIAGETDKVFANFRGLVLSTRGTGEPKDPAPTATTGGKRFHRFRVVEANSVLKGFWPFFRRLRPDADYRDWIGCGVFDWRALYVSSLGSQSEFDDRDEGDVDLDVPAGELPQRRVRGADWDDERYEEAPTTPQKDRPAPFRYLFLTKYEPHRKQIGRLVERINALGTMRLYALKNWAIIRDADAQIRIYGQELDASMAEWTKRVREMDDEFESKGEQKKVDQSKVLRAFVHEYRKSIPADLLVRIEEAADQFTTSPLLALRALADLTYEELATALRATRRENRSWVIDLKQLVDKLDKGWRDLNADWDRELAAENQLAESRLIAVSIGLDRLGKGAIGGIHYRINRARFYSDVFKTLAETLRVGLIETWTSYKQFLTRGLDPAFKFIDAVGSRLGGLRERLHGEMQSIQTSAIVNQTEATRDNTVQLENVLREVRMLVFVAEQLTVKAQQEQRWLNALRTRLVKMQIATAFWGAVFGTAIVAAGKLLFEYFKEHGWPF